MELGQALQRRFCLTRARVEVVYGRWRSCGLNFSSGGTAASASRSWILIWGASGRTLSRLFDLNVLLCPDENVLHFGDIVLHQMLVQRVGDLHPLMNAAGATSSLQLTPEPSNSENS